MRSMYLSTAVKSMSLVALLPVDMNLRDVISDESEFAASGSSKVWVQSVSATLRFGSSASDQADCAFGYCIAAVGVWSHWSSDPLSCLHHGESLNDLYWYENYNKLDIIIVVFSPWSKFIELYLFCKSYCYIYTRDGLIYCYGIDVWKNLGLNTYTEFEKTQLWEITTKVPILVRRTGQLIFSC